MLLATSDVLTAPIPGCDNPRGVHVGPMRGSGTGSMSRSEGSVSHWLGPLRDGSPEAAQKLWKCFIERLIALARKKLRALPHREAADYVPRTIKRKPRLICSLWEQELRP